jgi:hypothetical protein
MTDAEKEEEGSMASQLCTQYAIEHRNVIGVIVAVDQSR